MIRTAVFGIKKFMSAKYGLLAIAYMLVKVVIVFSRYTSAALEMDCRASPWDAALMFSAIEFRIFPPLIALLLCNAPFYDGSSQFTLIRTGRLRWIFGQVIYIGVLTAAVILTMWITAWIVMLPVLSFQWDWGIMLKSAAMTGGTFFSMSVPPLLPELWAPGMGMMSFLMTWLVSMFIGTMFMFLNFLFGKTVSFSAFGFLWFMQLAAPMIGLLNWGYTVTYLTPFTYANVFYAKNYAVLSDRPEIGYCIGVLAAGIVIFTVATVVGFCRKDLDSGKEE